jgi:hypothetical protein
MFRANPLRHARPIPGLFFPARGVCIQANRFSPLKTLHAGGALLRGAPLLVLVFRPGLSGQCGAGRGSAWRSWCLGSIGPAIGQPRNVTMRGCTSVAWTALASRFSVISFLSSQRIAWHTSR